MEEQKEQELYKKYPSLFAQTTLPMQQTCMCWGIGCGDGWYNIIDDMCKKLVTYNSATNTKTEFSQIKEKFGRLRVYTDTGDDIVYAIIKEAEEASANVCEICGEPGELVGKTWFSTLCKEHQK